MNSRTDRAILRELSTDPRSPLPATSSLSAPKRSRSKRAVFLGWLRKTHLYIGLWGALLGLLFGATGILLNHRSVLKIPIEKKRATNRAIGAAGARLRLAATDGGLAAGRVAMDAATSAEHQDAAGQKPCCGPTRRCCNRSAGAST
ncbi:hypothetical protein ACFS07_05380 [Undibacterium arcticum]